jgi:plasmid replication initiation protein
MTNPVNDTKNIQGKEVSTVNETKKPEFKYEFIPVKGVKLTDKKSFQFKIGNEIYLIRRAISTDFTEYDISTDYTLCIKMPKDSKTKDAF